VRLRLAVVTVLVLVAACGSSSAKPVARTRTCGPARATTRAASNQARVYQVDNTVYGCAEESTHSFRLGNATRTLRESRVGPIAIAGDVAAYGLTAFGVDTVRTQVVVRRLTDGGQLASFPATSAAGAESFQLVGSVVVQSDAAVAWIGQASSIISRGRELIEVHSAAGGHDSVLDSGAGIDPRSLQLHGSTLRWKHDGATRRATLH
jgi:hypothetical protein